LNIADDGREFAGRKKLLELLVEPVIQRMILELAAERQLTLPLEQTAENRAFVF